MMLVNCLLLYGKAKLVLSYTKVVFVDSYSGLVIIYTETIFIFFVMITNVFL